MLGSSAAFRMSGIRSSINQVFAQSQGSRSIESAYRRKWQYSRCISLEICQERASYKRLSNGHYQGGLYAL